MQAKLNIIRDGSDLFFVFTGDVAGLESFAGFPMSYGGRRGFAVKGEQGEKMPCLVARDFLQDRGVEVDTSEACGF